MVKKMFEALKKRHSNLGLSDETLNAVASVVVVGLPDDADDAAIEARASESRTSDMLKVLQSQFDKTRAEAAKKGPKGNEGVEKPVEGGEGKLDQVLSLLNEQKTSNEALQKRLEALEGASKQKDFDSKVAGIMEELKIPANLSGLCKSGLSPEMDETALRDKLGAAKKTLIESGVKFADSQTPEAKTTQTEAERKEAEDWVKEHAIPEES